MKYEEEAWDETRIWRRKLLKKQSIVQRLSKNTQTAIQRFIPDKAHNVITESIRHMVEVALAGNEFLPKIAVSSNLTLKDKEMKILERQKYYKRLAAIEGAGTGAGGIFLGLADFPLLLGIKMRFLFEVGEIYGLDTNELRERLFILHIFQLAFSSEQQKLPLINKISHWSTNTDEDKNIDWRKFQQDYRDSIDLIKMFQLVPKFGAAVGAYANSYLVNHLGDTAKHCYRIRLLEN